MSRPHTPDTLAGQGFKLALLMVQARLPQVDRLAMVSYDAATDLVSTFTSSSAEGVSVKRHEVPLSQLPTLQQVATTGRCRIVEDVAEASAASTPQGDWLKARACRSSFTLPVFRGRELAGFVFLESLRPAAFRPEDEGVLSQFAGTVAQLLLLSDAFPNGLSDAVQMATVLAHIPGVESRNHLRRVALYSRLMAQAVAPQNGLDEDFIDCVYRFAPLHDIGMAAIPGSLLRKPGRFDANDLARIKQHVELGALVMTRIAAQAGASTELALQVMRNIALCHHERGDGSGYPRGLLMAQTPIEARIVAVADVYDALSTVRPYRDVLPQQAIEKELLTESSRGRLDHACVAALLAAQSQCRDIQRRFPDTEDVSPVHAPAM